MVSARQGRVINSGAGCKWLRNLDFMDESRIVQQVLRVCCAGIFGGNLRCCPLFYDLWGSHVPSVSCTHTWYVGEICMKIRRRWMRLRKSKHAATTTLTTRGRIVSWPTTSSIHSRKCYRKEYDRVEEMWPRSSIAYYITFMSREVLRRFHACQRMIPGKQLKLCFGWWRDSTKRICGGAKTNKAPACISLAWSNLRSLDRPKGQSYQHQHCRYDRIDVMESQDLESPTISLGWREWSSQGTVWFSAN